MMVDIATQAAAHATDHVSVLIQHAGGIPNPGRGTPPPGSQKILTIIRWVAWLCFSVCIIGVLGAGAMMAISAFGSHQRGGEHMGRLGWVLGGCVVIGAASGLVGALV